MSPAPCSSFSLTFSLATYPINAPLPFKKTHTRKPAPRPSAPSRPWERTPCSATRPRCSREEWLGTPLPREQQQLPWQTRERPPAAPRALGPPEEESERQQERRRPLPPRPRVSPRARSHTTRSSGPSTR